MFGRTIRASRTQAPCVRVSDRFLSNRGVEVVSVEPGGPASVAGFVPDDLIVAVNDRVVTSVDDLHRLLTDFQNQPLLTLTIVRGERQLQVDVHPDVSR